MAELDLHSLSDVPLFNTKAVVQETGVPAATLRAWERRYAIPEPNRTASNYRLYSERDIALIRWLRDRVAGGMTISQAVELFRRMEAGAETPGVLPGEHSLVGEARTSLNWDSLHERLLRAFLAFDEEQADMLVSEAFAVHSVEDVCYKLLHPALVEIGERWHQGEVSIPIEHFATAYVKRKLMTLFNAQPSNPTAPMVVTGCAPHEHHEVGILLFSIFLRRHGVRVVYLGQNVPLLDMQSAIASLQPTLLCLSASTLESAGQLVTIGRMIAELPEPRPTFAFGGQAFERYPGLAERVPGVYLGAEQTEAIPHLLGLLRGRAMKASLS